MPMQHEEITNSLDASLGLIYRLNILWRNVDMYTSNGKYDEWNNELDCIFKNLLFEKELELVRDDNGEIKEVKVNEDDHKIYSILSKKVFGWKMAWIRELKTNKKSSKLPIIRSRWYEALMLKDIWLRKLMFREKLYLNRKKSAPGTALFGSFANKKR